MRALSLLVALLALAACGRVGPIRPPGPRSEVIYPRLYPYIPPTAGTGAATTPGPATAEPTLGVGAAATSESEQSQGGGTITRPGSPR